MNTFETPFWLRVEGSRLLLRRFPSTAALERTLTDQQAVECALAVAEALSPESADEEEASA